MTAPTRCVVCDVRTNLAAGEIAQHLDGKSAMEKLPGGILPHVATQTLCRDSLR